MIKKLIYNIEFTISALALFFASAAANQASPFQYHQPQAPDELRQLRKF